MKRRHLDGVLHRSVMPWFIVLLWRAAERRTRSTAAITGNTTTEATAAIVRSLSRFTARFERQVSNHLV